MSITKNHSSAVIGQSHFKEGLLFARGLIHVVAEQFVTNSSERLSVSPTYRFISAFTPLLDLAQTLVNPDAAFVVSQSRSGTFDAVVRLLVLMQHQVPCALSETTLLVEKVNHSTGDRSVIQLVHAEDANRKTGKRS